MKAISLRLESNQYERLRLLSFATSTPVSEMIRGQGVKIAKVRGVRRDENAPLIRLADAVCGLIRDALYDGHSEAIEIFEPAARSGIIRSLGH